MRSILVLSILAFSANLLAAKVNLSAFTCTGSAEYGNVQITNISVKNLNVLITYSVDNKFTTQKYILTEKNRNGSTDINQPAYFIGATKSGDKNDYDDMSLPHLGQYKDGFGSEVAFNIKGNRVFGTVTCQ